MPVSFNNLPLALHSINNLGRASTQLSSTFEKLSSGQRINRASDDSAGLAVADKLRADARIAAVAIRNANDGISYTSIADSALSEVSSILTRMAELAEQSSNGVYTNTQRSALSSEFLSLGSEIQRIAETTEFNNLTLLSNSSAISFQVGIDGASNGTISIAAVLGTLSSMQLANSNSSALVYSIIDNSTAGSQAAATAALAAINGAIASVTTTRGTLGATESRLNSAINTLSMARENFVAAESRIRDVDVAEETAQLTRLTILQQAATAIVAQANLQPQLVLQLLG